MHTRYLKIYCSLFLLQGIFFQQAFAQISFSARVIDEKGGTAIQNASVYFNNTTIATKTNAKGEFTFENVRFFNTELVIYCPGYEPIVYKPTTEQLAVKKFVFKMKTKLPPDTAQQAILTANKKNTRLDEVYFSTFRVGFVGITREASHCLIVNPEDIYFGPDQARGGFNAFADTIIVVINNQTGYRLHYLLADFFCDAFNRQSYFTGYCWYEPLGDDKQYQLARNHCYFGSSQHFYRSLVANKLYQEGFGVFMKDTTTSALNGEDNYIPLPAQKILWIDSSNNFSIDIAGKLIVQYNRDPYAKYYLRDILPYVDGDFKKGMEANIEIKAAPLELTTIGVPVDDSNIEYGGFWSYEKLANLLPLDYQPDEKPLK